MLHTPLCDFFDIEHPIISAPMAFAAGGRLAAAMSLSGGLGLIGGAYGDADWIDQAFLDAGNAPVGCGFITWHLQKAMQEDERLLQDILAKKPKALMLSFGDPAPFAKLIKDAGVAFICQVQTLKDAAHAIDCGADVIVAQGGEAGGHGEGRGTMAFVPEAADLIANSQSNALLCAAGGIADGRGLAAALMLGADGVLMGSRLWASMEADVHANMLTAAKRATGDDTIRSSVMDIARHLNWPERYTARVLKNDFTERWHDDIDGLLENADEEAAKWKEAWQKGDTTTANTFVGEATGLINEVKSVADIIENMVREAKSQLQRFS